MKRSIVKSMIWLFIVLALLLMLFLWVVIMHHSGYGLIKQDSASMPQGVYLQMPTSTSIKRHEVVLFKPSPSLDRYLVNHHWLGPNQNMMKVVFGLPGDHACVVNEQVFINHHLVAKRLKTYDGIHPLKQISFCETLAHNEYMLMSTHSARSYDSRYFGPVKRDQIVGQAVLL